MKIILNILTHGDERIGLKVVKEIKKLNISKRILSFQIANQKAFESKKRFIDQDLNRSFPGKKNGNYEERLAYKLSSTIKSADIVVDVHSTKSGMTNIVIVTKLDNKTRECIKALQPKNVLVMNATKNNALISQAKIGIGFEYGGDNDSSALKNIVNDLKRLFYYLGLVNNKSKKRKRVTQYFDVTVAVPKPPGYQLSKKVKNYKLVRKGETFAGNGTNFLVADENFYPILFGRKNYKDIFGFKGKKII